LNYGDGGFRIFDLGLRISNKEREREQAVLLRPWQNAAVAARLFELALLSTARGKTEL